MTINNAKITQLVCRPLSNMSGYNCSLIVLTAEPRKYRVTLMLSDEIGGDDMKLLKLISCMQHGTEISLYSEGINDKQNFRGAIATAICNDIHITEWTETI